MATETWQEVCKRKREEQAASIPKEWLLPTLPPLTTLNVLDVPRSCGLLTERELLITELDDVHALLAKLASSEWSTLEVTTAFAKRACIAHQLVNCLTEIFIPRALERAKWLDDCLKREGKPVGPLHGLPISLKDQFSIKGLDTVMGYAAWVGKPAEKDCALVEMLLSLGAVLYVRTNVPQTLMWGETYNHVFLRTLHPQNRLLTPGGSSGGEGALLALRGSPLGVGTDIGGSIRIPANWCGLYGLRPSYHRLPYEGARNSLEGFETVSSVLGPLSPSLAGLKVFTKALIDARPWDYDPVVVRKGWDTQAEQLAEHGSGRGMCFALMEDDGLVRPHPPVRRALREVKAALERAGHTVIPWEPFKPREIRDVLNKIFLADGGADFLLHTTLTPPHEPLLTTLTPGPDEPFSSHPSFSKPVDAPLESALLLPSTPISVHSLYSLQRRKRDLLKGFLDHWLRTSSLTGTGRPVDAILAPAAATAAPPHGMNMYDYYCEYWNVVDSPCCVLPVTKVRKEMDVKESEWEYRSEEEGRVHRLYDPELFDGLPVGIQVVGRKGEEEAVLGMAEVVDGALKAMRAAEEGLELVRGIT